MWLVNGKQEEKKRIDSIEIKQNCKIKILDYWFIYPGFGHVTVEGEGEVE